MARCEIAAARAAGLFAAASAAFMLAPSAPAFAADDGPIKIGVIAKSQSVAGSSIPQAAQIAADEINAKGGVDGRKIEIVSYDCENVGAAWRA